MSVTIHWRPVSQKSKYFLGGTSTSFDVLKRVFGNIVTEQNVPTLRAMSVVANDGFYDEIADTIERVGEIEVWSEN